MGQGFDTFMAVLFGAGAIAVAVVGIRRGEPSKRIREKACFVALFAVLGLRGLLPPTPSLLGSGLYIAALLALGITALWKGSR